MWKLKDQVRLGHENIAFLEGLPDNFPETKINSRLRMEIDTVYMNRIGRVERKKKYTCFELEQMNKWPSGERIKKHEAQRILLGWLSESERHRPVMTDKEAAKHFYGSLDNRASWIQLLSLIYEEV